MLYENCYISANCNQTPTAAHWGENNLICYGSCNAVFIYNPNLGSGGKIIDTLVGHNGRVNSVRWITGEIPETEIISGSADGDVIVWTLKGSLYVQSTLKGHESNVNIVDGLYRFSNRNGAIICTASMDSTVRIWYREKATDHFTSIQSLELGHGLCVGLKLGITPNKSTIILACALDNAKIQLYVDDAKDDATLTFEKATALEGHEDWVRGLDFTSDGDDLLLASSSQDNTIRLWRITPVSDEIETSQAKRINVFYFKTAETQYKVTIESVLLGHEGWVYSVNWNLKALQVLSASLDKSMIIWEFDPEAKLWMDKVRVGEVGGNTLGFYGGVFAPDGATILGHSYHGAFHIWTHNKDTGVWEPQVTVGGHFNEVVDLAWDLKGDYLLTVSYDQTTRIHAPWPKDQKLITWHEIGRPQVHGYDMNSVAILSRYKFASSAEEKVIRTFQAPKNFVDNFRRICQLEETDADMADVGPEGASVPSLGLSNKAVFGHDNKESVVVSDKDPYPEESYFSAVELHEPPTEETLIQNTLWPEIQKLYGHGYEVYCLAASPDGRILASACKATTKEHAAIILCFGNEILTQVGRSSEYGVLPENHIQSIRRYETHHRYPYHDRDTTEWKILRKLFSHTLTVTQIAFSPDGERILSVSRDRRWSVFEKKETWEDYELVATTDKNTAVHTRIIWCCAWSHDSEYFSTGSRDGKLVVWTRHTFRKGTPPLGQYSTASSLLDMKTDSLTALAFAPVMLGENYLLAVGTEAGRILIFSWNTENCFTPVVQLMTKVAHHLTVKRVSFRPVLGRGGYKIQDKNILQLASCGSDHSVRIYDLLLDKLIYKLPKMCEGQTLYEA